MRATPFLVKKGATGVRNRVRASESSSSALSSTTESGDKRSEFPILLAALLVAVSVTNRVLYKVALVPLHGHVVQFSFVTALTYAIVYLSTLFARRQAGIVTEDMLRYARKSWKLFAVIGLLEAVSMAVGMSAARFMPGTVLPLISQLFLFFQMTAGVLVLRKVYSVKHVLGATGIATGVALASFAAIQTSSSSSSVAASSASAFPWSAAIVYVLGLGLPAFASVMKESIFARYKDDKKLDVFVVNSIGSTFQALSLMLALPLGISMAATDGLGWLPHDPYSWLAVLSYIVVNIVFNVTALTLLRNTSAVVTSLTLSFSVPLASLAYSLPLPYLGAAPLPEPMYFALGNALMILGASTYAKAGMAKTRGGS